MAYASTTLDEQAATLREMLAAADANRLSLYRPYPKQEQFHSVGAHFRERLFLAANQSGKTWAGAMEVAMHLTGRYPEWWKGRRFPEPTVWWAAGVTSESTRDNVQRLLFGRVGQLGTGSIPGETIIGAPTAARGVSGLMDTALIRHTSGGVSQLSLKSYEKGREKWQGETLHGVWYDEEPPLPIYIEGLTRTNATGGLVFVTFTPLLGMSDVVRRFLSEENDDRAHVRMEIEDALHIDDAQRKRIIDSYPDYEREARTKGIPGLGSGRVFPVAESAITCDAVPIPKTWAHIGGLDFGWDHPTAAVHICHDRDADVIYVVGTYRERQQTPLYHTAALKKWGDWVPWAWPHDGLQHDKQSGTVLKDAYIEHGLSMLPEKATFPDGTAGLEAGIMEMLERMQTGRLKVFRHLSEWFDEFRLYHRKDGLIVKERDDLMSATRYAIMMLRHARTKPQPRTRRREWSAWAA